MKGKILLVADSLAMFREMKQVAQLLNSSGRYHPVFLMDHPGYGYDREIGICRAEKLDYICRRRAQAEQQVGSVPCGSTRRVSAGIGGKDALKRWARPDSAARNALFFVWKILVAWRRSLAGALIDFVLLYGDLLRQRSLLRRINPKLLILPGTDKGHMAIAVKAAAEMGIPSVVVPYAVIDITVGLRQVSEMPGRSFKRWSCRLVAKIYPKWASEWKGIKMIAGDVSKIIALEWLGVSPANPWGDTIGRADILAVESRRMAQIYEQAGLDRKKFVLTGSLSDDVYYKILQDSVNQRELLYKQLCLPQGRPLLLLNLTPDQGVASHLGIEFSSYGEIVEFLIQIITGVKGYNVMISPHPRANIKVLKGLMQDHMRVVEQSIFSLLPLTDIFISDISSVLRGAIVCGKPAICYDVWGYRDPVFRGEDGIITVETRNDFSTAVTRLTSDKAYYDRIKACQAARSAEWGILDGRSGERALNLFDAVIKSREKKQ